MRISGNETSSVILCQSSLKVENRGPKVPKQAEAKGLLMKLCTLNLIQVF